MSPFSRRLQSTVRYTPPASPQGFSYVTSVHGSGRYFLDQFGDPILVKGDSPWSAMVDLSSSQWSTWCISRKNYGFNAAIISLIGTVTNGGPSDSGATYDGILPFISGDITNPNPTYWARIDQFIQTAHDNGITLFLYIVDGWTILGGCPLDVGNTPTGDFQSFGAWVANRYASMPNIVWMFGGDYDGDSIADPKMNACLTGIRSTGDTRIASCQMIYQRSWTTQYAFWASKVNFQHVYSYSVQYDAVYAAYQSAAIPALFMEGYYGGMNDGSSSLTIRKQAAWAMTQGSPGHVYGTDDWLFNSGWQTRLNSYHVADVAAVHAAVESLEWWKLAPSRTLITAGAGTLVNASGVGQAENPSKDPSNSDYATAGLAADGSLALIYMPNAARTITINTALIGPNATARWIDPSSGASVSTTFGATYSRSTANAHSGADWLLVIAADAL